MTATTLGALELPHYKGALEKCPGTSWSGEGEGVPARAARTAVCEFPPSTDLKRVLLLLAYSSRVIQQSPNIGALWAWIVQYLSRALLVGQFETRQAADGVYFKAVYSLQWHNLTSLVSSLLLYKRKQPLPRSSLLSTTPLHSTALTSARLTPLLSSLAILSVLSVLSVLSPLVDTLPCQRPCILPHRLLPTVPPKGLAVGSIPLPPLFFKLALRNVFAKHTITPPF
jgi:hypothetical protein